MSPARRENLSQSYAADATSVAVARQALTRFAHAAGATPEELDGIRLAASEALTNAVLHAYGGGAGQVHVSAAVASGELWMLIADDGCGLQPGRRSGARGLGMGLALISEVADGFEIVKRSGGGTELRMRFSLEAVSPTCVDQVESSCVDQVESSCVDQVESSCVDQVESSSASASRPASSTFSTTK